MYILGLDPASKNYGYAIISTDLRDRPEVLISGVWKLKDRPCLEIVQRINTLLLAYDLDVACIEMPFVHPKHRLDTIIPICQVRGASIATLQHRGIPVEDVSPSEVKKLATGKGNADKEQVARWVEFQTGLKTLKADESDAIAVALAQASRERAKMLELRIKKS